MNAGSLRYAGFWSRFGAMMLDFLITLPLLCLYHWGAFRFRLFPVYYYIPDTFFCLFYSVFLVRRYGGTPGKLLLGIRIRKLDGTPAGYREAILRFLPDFILFLLGIAASFCVMSQMDNREFPMASFKVYGDRFIALAPSWNMPLNIIILAWGLGEFIVMLTNRRRRALHDFIAGTVVVHAKPASTPDLSSAPTAG